MGCSEVQDFCSIISRGISWLTTNGIFFQNLTLEILRVSEIPRLEKNTPKSLNSQPLQRFGDFGRFFLGLVFELISKYDFTVHLLPKTKTSIESIRSTVQYPTIFRRNFRRTGYAIRVRSPSAFVEGSLECNESDAMGTLKNLVVWIREIMLYIGTNDNDGLFFLVAWPFWWAVKTYNPHFPGVFLFFFCFVLQDISWKHWVP